MNVVQAGFDILYGLCVLDGEAKDEEVQVIGQFLKDNFNGQFNVEQEINLLTSLNVEGLLGRMEEAAEYLKNQTSMETKLTMMDFSIALIAADGVVTDAEKTIFNILGNKWGIDVGEYVKNIQKRMK